MPQIIVFANQKGGVSKTTTTSAFAAGFSRRGWRVLAIDADPQANLSDSCGADTQELSSLYDLLRRDCGVRDTIQSLAVFDIIAANIMLSACEQELVATGKEYRLREQIEPVLNDYDYIIIDTPPSLGILTINAFTAADTVVIPTTPGIFSASGIQQLYNTIQNTRKYCNPQLSISGVLMTRYNPQANIAKDMRELTTLLSGHIGAPLFKTHIRSSVAAEEAQAKKVDIFSHKAQSTVAQDYAAFVDEYLKGHKPPPKPKKSSK